MFMELFRAMRHSLSWWPLHWHEGLRLLLQNLVVGMVAALCLASVYSLSSRHSLQQYFDNILLVMIIFSAMLPIVALMFPYDMKERERQKKEKE